MRSSIIYGAVIPQVSGFKTCCKVLLTCMYDMQSLNKFKNILRIFNMEVKL